MNLETLSGGLFDEEPIRRRVVGEPAFGRVRRTDPETSRRAAARQGTGATEAILRVAFGADRTFTDDELAAVLPEFLAATVKTARSRLTKAGKLVDSGSKRPGLNTGSLQIVWRLARPEPGIVAW